jgi:CheY-like chemotaxis protein
MSKKGLHVLMVDDDDLNNILVKEIILNTLPTKKIICETSGWEALDYLQNCRKTGDFPDLIIVDVKMPEMDGFEFLERYEKLFDKSKTTRITIATSSLLDYERTKATKSPLVNLFINKPLDEKKVSFIYDTLF